MALVSALLLALGVAMDATAVALVRGLAVGRVRSIQPRDALRVALLFGGFQSGMSAIGCLIGDRAGPLVEQWDHWIAFGLLCALGAKMVFEALRGGDGAAAAAEVAATSSPDGALPAGDPFRLGLLLPLAVATSIDALAVGVTLPLLAAPVAVSLALIGVVTAALSAAAVYLGRRVGASAGGKLDLLGGVVLIGIGTKILLEHLGS
jgi:manganese efflux pump family protein